ncbi:MAG TPA: 3'-5' exonuclease [Ktedonobacterales bacterium]
MAAPLLCLALTIAPQDWGVSSTYSLTMAANSREIHHRIYAHVKGQAIGTQLTQIVQQVAHLSGYSWPNFGQYLEEYKRQQVEKLQQFEHSESELDELEDRVAAVEVCFKMFAAKDAVDLCRKIESIFNDGEPDVLLSTVHRAKGLEADRIFLLNPDEMPLSWPNQQAWEAEQERNIKYVALTRSRKELYWVHTSQATGC